MRPLGFWFAVAGVVAAGARDSKCSPDWGSYGGQRCFGAEKSQRQRLAIKDSMDVRDAKGY